MDSVTPGVEEQSKARILVEKIMNMTLDLGRSKNIEMDFKLELVGSMAKGTQLRGGDVDIFVLFDQTVPKEDLKDTILLLGKTLFQKHVIRYAEHPYVRGMMDGMEIDLVPCYHLSSGDPIQSAVDRTPFHTRYVQTHLKSEQQDEVRLLKQFLKGIGCYGAENKTMGFSGYLCELLVLKSGTFLEVLKMVSSWKEEMIIDLEDLGYSGHRERSQIIVVDPVDGSRNVASPISDLNLSRFIHAARRFLEHPSMTFFFPISYHQLPSSELEELVRNRGVIICIEFSCVDIVDDILYPQLRLTVNRVNQLMTDHGFPVDDSGIVVTDSVFLLLHTAIRELPKRKLHRGPKVYHREHSTKFLKKWESEGAFLKDDRWYVYAPVKYQTPHELLIAEIPQISTGRHVKQSISKGYRLLNGKEIPEFVLSKFLDKRMPWEIET